MRGITSIGHVAIKVRDLDVSLDFYRERLQFRDAAA